MCFNRVPAALSSISSGWAAMANMCNFIILKKYNKSAKIGTYTLFHAAYKCGETVHYNRVDVECNEAQKGIDAVYENSNY
jgi:hypothetical protein